MNRDRDAVLNKLSQELLAEEEQPASPEQAPLVFRNFANNYGEDLRNFASNYSAYNADRTDEDPQEFAHMLMEENRKERIWPLAAGILVLLGGILGVLAYWCIHMGVLS